MLQSQVMASELGFGGTGGRNRTEQMPDEAAPFYCVDDGPFWQLRPSYRISLGNRLQFDEHCLHRDVQERSDSYSGSKIANILQERDFLWFSRRLETSPHNTIHSTIGGEMGPPTSPNGNVS
jgi:tyrosinase